MNMVIRKTTGTVLGLMAAMICGAPAIADDTELLLVTPPDPSQLKPNVIFILDTSGSMGATQEFGATYDPNVDYSSFGACDLNNYYYTDGVVPICDSLNTLYVDKASYHCAASAIQIGGVGSYTGVMVQYRENASGVKEWMEIETGNSSDDVECEADSGIHGDGRPTYLG